MSTQHKTLHPISILFLIIILAACCTWIIPAGEYKKLIYKEGNFEISSRQSVQIITANQHSLDSLQIKIPLQKFIYGDIIKPISIPNTYTPLPPNRANLISIIKAPIEGIYEAIDIILLVFVMGGFINLFNQSGAMVNGITSLSNKLNKQQNILIFLLVALFALGGASFGMAEETLVFYPVLVPLFTGYGYNKMVPLAIIFGGAQLGYTSSFSNPFSTIIASNASGINWKDGLAERLFILVITVCIYSWYIINYGKKNKTLTPTTEPVNKTEKLSVAIKMQLWLFGLSFLAMIIGVIFYKWWLTEITTLFLASSIIFFFITSIKEKDFIAQFINGAQDLLGVALIIGVARGITIILNNGYISDSILYYTSSQLQQVPALVFIVLLLLFFIILSFFISSSSGMAVLTMPIIGALAIIVNIPGKTVVNAYLSGMSIMGFLTPAGLILPSLAMVDISFKEWLKFIRPFLIILFIICLIWLWWGIY